MNSFWYRRTLMFVRFIYRQFVYAFLAIRAWGRSCRQGLQSIFRIRQAQGKLHHGDGCTLADLWESPRISRTVFVAFDIRVSDQIPSAIIDIGLSQWCPNEESRNKTYHWQIKEPDQPGILSNQWETSEFMYGTTESILISEIEESFSAVFEELQFKYIVVCLVGHHVEEKLDMLRNYFNIPDGFVIIDTRRAWQARHPEEDNATLRYCLETTSLSSDGISNNSGNAAHAILQLTRRLGQML